MQRKTFKQYKSRFKRWKNIENNFYNHRFSKVLNEENFQSVLYPIFEFCLSYSIKELILQSKWKKFLYSKKWKQDYKEPKLRFRHFKKKVLNEAFNEIDASFLNYWFWSIFMEYILDFLKVNDWTIEKEFLFKFSPIKNSSKLILDSLGNAKIRNFWTIKELNHLFVKIWMSFLYNEPISTNFFPLEILDDERNLLFSLQKNKFNFNLQEIFLFVNPFKEKLFQLIFKHTKIPKINVLKYHPNSIEEIKKFYKNKKCKCKCVLHLRGD